ncbi:DNA primase, partial [bacterium]|nr:DNA primase [bacterium]
MMERTLRKVPDHVIAEVRDRVDLVELIGAYVTLKRSGKNHMGLCPFHQEKTPSFNVSPDRGIYHCFGCGVTGDGIRFLMEHDNLSFQEALRNMAQRAGVDLSPFEGRGDGVAHDYDQLYAAHAIAARLFEKLLQGKEGEAARAEIRRRGYSEEIVTQYRLGASADSWDRLLTEAKREGIPPEIMEKGGLAIRRDARGEGDGGGTKGARGGRGHYDRFRGRLMFPILAVGPKVIAFGGRVLDDGEPKYLNSPESPLFRKRETLYGIPQALSALRETRHAILVEGYTDVLGLANGGIHGSLAALGTAFGSAHAAWLARSCDRVTVVFDGDDAGRKAAYGSAGPLLGAGLDVRMVMLPPGEDPDTLVRKQGADAMRALLDAGAEVVPTLCGNEAWESPAGRERAVRRVLDALVSVEDPLRRTVYLDQLAELVG